MPAWIVADANRYTRETGKTTFIIYQGAWSFLNRSFERDILPMARTLGHVLAPYTVLGGGKLRTDAEDQCRLETGEKGQTIVSQDWMRNEYEKKMSAALENVAKEVNAEHITAVAIGYVMQKTPYVFPDIGGRKVEQLMGNSSRPGC